MTEIDTHIHCWKCGIPIHPPRNNTMEVIGWFGWDFHSKTCPRCSEEAADTIRKYDYTLVQATGGHCYDIDGEMDYGDIIRLRSFGIESNMSYDRDENQAIINEKHRLSPPTNIHVRCLNGEHDFIENGNCKRCGSVDQTGITINTLIPCGYFINDPCDSYGYRCGS